MTAEENCAYFQNEMNKVLGPYMSYWLETGNAKKCIVIEEALYQCLSENSMERRMEL